MTNLMRILLVHCNIKPETLRLARCNDDVSIRLVDFDMAGIVLGEENPGRCLSQRRGTLYYIAPEVLSGLLYGKPVDMWSVGKYFGFLLSVCCLQRLILLHLIYIRCGILHITGWLSAVFRQHQK